MKINVNFLFGALTFLHIFLPLYLTIKEQYSTTLQPRFFIRHNIKSYGDPIIHAKVYQKLFEEHQIEVLPGTELRNYPGINFCVDGDTYGPRESCWKQSLLLNIDRSKFVSLSFVESLNFKWSYHYYNDLVDYTVLPNEIYSQIFKLNGNNLYLGNPKYDIKFNSADIYQKHSLDPTKRYVTFFYPRFERGIKKFGAKFPKYYQNLMKWFEDLGYVILTKNRTKVKQRVKVNRQYFVDTDYYPHISMELIEISELVVFFGSAVIEEIVMAHKPFVEFLFDNVNRLSFLRDPSYAYTITKLPGEEEFKKNVQSLLQHQSREFQKIIDQYLFEKHCGQKIINQAIKLYKEKTNPIILKI